MTKLRLTLLATAIVFMAGCSPDPDKTAVQKQYTSQADCQKDWNIPGDCTRASNSHGGFFFMSPYFYPWGGVYHNNGIMSYNQRVPTSGYTPVASGVQSRLASRVDFSQTPTARANAIAARTASTRGGFGGTGRASGGFSSGG